MEAYARLKEADVAVLIAEDFEDLMEVTCNLRNEDSSIDWYLIQVKVNEHREVIFNKIVKPSIDIQAERKTFIRSEFWEPLKREGIFAGKAVTENTEWISKKINEIEIWLNCTGSLSKVEIWIRGDNRHEKRKSICNLFPPEDYSYSLRETPKYAIISFPILDKGKNNRSEWDEIRTAMTKLGEEIYHKIESSDV